MKKDDLRKKDKKIDYVSLVFVYVLSLSIMLVSSAFTVVLAIKEGRLNEKTLTLWIVGSALLITAAIIFGVVIWKKLVKYYGDQFDPISILLITGYVLSSLVVAAFVTIYSSNNLTFELADRMVQLSWIVFGISNALYLAGIGSVFSKQSEQLKPFLSNYSIYLYPMVVMAAALVATSISLYCFYDSIKGVTGTLIYISFIASIMTVPYYLLLCFYLLKKKNI